MRKILNMAVLTVVLGLPLQMALQMAIADRTLAQSSIQLSPNRQEQADQLVQYASQLLRGSRFDEAIKTYEQALQIYRELKDRNAESVILNNIGLTYFRQQQYQKALGIHQQSLAIKKQLGDRKGEATSLSNIGAVYNSLKQYDQAINFFQQALTIRQQIGDRKGEATSLSNLGNGYLSLKQHQQAADFFQKAVAVYQQIGDRNSEGLNLGNLGTAYQRLGQYQNAATAYQQALASFKQLGNLENQGYSLADLGDVYRKLGQYSQSVNSYTEALAIAKQTQDLEFQKNLLNDLGTAQMIVGDYKKAINAYQGSLALAKKLGDSNGLGNALIGIGNGYNSLAQYQKAIDLYQQALALKKQSGDIQSEAKLLGNLANTYKNLGNLNKTIELNLQSIDLFKKIGDREGWGKSLNNLGIAYSDLGDYPKAIETHQQSLAISKQLGYLGGEAKSLNNLGSIYGDLGQQQKAIESYQQALAINRTTGDRNGEGLVLGNLGNAYIRLKQYDQAYNFFQQTLSIFKQNGDRDKESLSFSNLGLTLTRLDQPELAILFYKQAINLRESIRKDIRGLSKEDQTTYLESIASSYKKLANLLLKQGRIMEALQVLDLLKVQELEDYLKNIKGSDRTAQGIRVLAAEKALIPQLSKISFENSKTLNSQLATQIQQLPKSELNQVPDYLRQIPQGAVLLYPLILGDRLEIILFSPNALPISRSVNISQAKLESLVKNFKAELIDAGSEDYQENAIALYNLLIKPIESELAQTKATTILYAPDNILRYVPLAALYDGKQWLIEKYRISNLIAYSLSDFSPKPKIQPSILAGAFGGKAGEKKFGQQSLPATIKEVQAIANAFQNSTTLLESDFSRQTTESKFKNYNILHFATHAEFNVGAPDNSFIIFGNGDKIRLNEINDWQIPNIELIVLSACQTGVGKLGSGVEILGFGYQVQKAGAKSAIASLWSVDDQGTQALMATFYRELKNGDVTPIEALHRAQVAMIKSSEFKHPSYWSAFFVIGNGL